VALKNRIKKTPGNGARLFNKYFDAISQPAGELNFILHEELNTFYIKNLNFNSQLIKHDQNYCTVNSHHLFETSKYLDEFISKIDLDSVVIEIGCGQGEFLDHISNNFRMLYGFDPVCTRNEVNFYSKYWDPSVDKYGLNLNVNSQIVFIMRCVLPHILNPIQFLDKNFDHFPNAKFLVEYQSIDWTISNSAWQQYTHDHVNLFDLSTFQKRYKVIKCGEFAQGEWEWVFFERKNDKIHSSKLMDNFHKKLHKINTIQDLQESQLEKILNQNNKWIIYGSSGKGCNIAYNLLIRSHGELEIFATDSNHAMHGKYLETSGVEIISIEQAVKKVEHSGFKVIISNINHLDHVRKFFGKGEIYNSNGVIVN